MLESYLDTNSKFNLHWRAGLEPMLGHDSLQTIFFKLITVLSEIFIKKNPNSLSRFNSRPEMTL